MKIIRGLPAASDRPPCALTIGNFDGVHRGHQALLADVVQAARARELVPSVMTFEPHPREFFAPESAPPRVANLRDKLAALAAGAIERVFIAHFDRRFAALTAEQFIAEILVAGLATRWLIVGEDFRFGAGRAGDFALLASAGVRAGLAVVREAAVCADGERISSSSVRTALAAGDLARARNLLGHPYAISGRVLHGRKLGRTLGFPTLNLRIAHRPGMQRPAVQGIFAVRVHGLGIASSSPPLAGVASVGMRPTIDDSGRWLLEVHLFDFAREVYGHLVRVEFVQRIRDELKYDTLAQLAAAIDADAARARSLLAFDRVA